MTAPISTIQVIVGSTNPTKVGAAKRSIARFHTNSDVTMVSYNANPGITDWKSLNAIGQPFGARQTAFGAINRMNDCWKQQFSQDSHAKTYAIGLENGLVKPIEVGKSGELWFDVCFVATRNSNPASPIIIKRGTFIRTEFAPSENNDLKSFDEAVVTYQKSIMPLIAKRIDLYLEWTKNAPSGPKTREYFLEECLVKAIQEQSKVEDAQGIVGRCAASGMTASAGPRYQNMLWTRDLAYMSSVYLKNGYAEKFLEALRNLKAAQVNQHIVYNNGYATFDRFGNLPIVCIPEVNKCAFLRQRIRGTMDEPSWQIQLWNFCNRKFPEQLNAFPLPTIDNNLKIENATLDALSFSELKSYYQALLKFQTSLKAKINADDEQPPKPSFSLKNFMDGTLEDLTPGTRDSEIHYIRAIFSYLENHPQKKDIILEEFGASIAKAVFFLYTNVIDSEDGLPRGADSRDIFADILYDSKVVTNAVFWYQALEILLKHTEGLQKSPFGITIKEALADQKGIKIPQALLNMVDSNNLKTTFQNELNRLRSAIQNKLLCHADQFVPRDFIPGVRAGIALTHPINPTPIDKIITRDNPTFVNGKTVDCQSLAHAVLTGLVDKRYFDQVIDCFVAADSKIGVQVFVPISGKTDEESLLLQQVKGQVVWPHVSWTVVRALIAMNTERSLNMAEEQRDKLMALGGCSEWYAIHPGTQEPVKGGDPQQGWAATSMIMAINDFYKYYSS